MSALFNITSLRKTNYLAYSKVSV